MLAVARSLSTTPGWFKTAAASIRRSLKPTAGRSWQPAARLPRATRIWKAPPLAAVSSNLHLPTTAGSSPCCTMLGHAFSQRNGLARSCRYLVHGPEFYFPAITNETAACGCRAFGSGPPLTNRTKALTPRTTATTMAVAARGFSSRWCISSSPDWSAPTPRVNSVSCAVALGPRRTGNRVPMSLPAGRFFRSRTRKVVARMMV